ncbi:hypothetical protein [Saccharothrix xinjiangensis]|uniref:Secreted protein n=1 Tax=Saccharothrix xinjiangensis TaxID=204798 RepID=A0ABV9XVY9_9PSEU
MSTTAVRALPRVLVPDLLLVAISHDSYNFCRIPSAAVLRQPLTKNTVRRYPHYFLAGGLVPGPGYQRARQTLCPHQYYLTDSCPNC